MSRCIAFDQTTADALESRTGMLAEIHPEPRDPAMVVAKMLQSRAAVAVVPSAQPGALLVIRFLRQEPPPGASTDQGSRMAPAGFLGLSDSIDMDSGPEQPKKWWQRIIE